MKDQTLTTYQEASAPALTAAPGRREWGARGVALGGAAGAAAVVPLFGDPLAGAKDGTAVGDALVAAANATQMTSLLAVFASAGLIVAAARVGAALPGLAGRVATAAGAATAVLLALYYSSFGAGTLVASMLESHSPGLGEATLVAANLIELARFGTGFAVLVAAAVALRSARLPKAVGIVAIVLAVAQVVPMTGWVAAMAVPVWLGVAGALARPAHTA